MIFWVCRVNVCVLFLGNSRSPRACLAYRYSVLCTAAVILRTKIGRLQAVFIANSSMLTSDFSVSWNVLTAVGFSDIVMVCKVTECFRYAWTIVNCATCESNMGWLFTATNKRLQPRSFWGIRSSQLADNAQEKVSLFLSLYMHIFLLMGFQACLCNPLEWWIYVGLLILWWGGPSLVRMFIFTCTQHRGESCAERDAPSSLYRVRDPSHWCYYRCYMFVHLSSFASLVV